MLVRKFVHDRRTRKYAGYAPYTAQFSAYTESGLVRCICSDQHIRLIPLSCLEPTDHLPPKPPTKPQPGSPVRWDDPGTPVTEGESVSSAQYKMRCAEIRGRAAAMSAEAQRETNERKRTALEMHIRFWAERQLELARQLYANPR